MTVVFGVANTEYHPSDEYLQARAWCVCCDFHDAQEEIAAHLKKWEAEYGKMFGQIIQAPAGWKILPYRDIVPQVHREFDEAYGWLPARRGRSTMTPIWARPTGRTRAYAIPV